MTPDSITLDGIRIDVVDRATLLARFTKQIVYPFDQIFIGFYAALLRQAAEDPGYADALRAAHVVYPDGAGALLAIRVLAGRGTGAERLATTDVWRDMTSVAVDLGKSVAFIGGTEEVCEEFVDKLNAVGAVVAYHRNGYFRDQGEEDQAIEMLRRSGATLVFVGLGSGRQEAFCQRASMHGNYSPQTFVTVGGLADHVVGATTRAPRPIQRAGFEWLWRVAQEPRRLMRRYVKGNSYFLKQLLHAKHLRART